jgi:hypothetical protein
MDSKSNISSGGLTVTQILVLVLLLFSNCGTESIIVHSPIMPYYVCPTKDSIKVGDTIWLEAKIPYEMRDFETGEIANYKNVDFKSYFDIQILTDTTHYISDQPNPSYATSKFTLIKSVGDCINDGEVCRINYLSRNDSFLLAIGFIANYEGFYRFNLAYNPGGIAHGTNEIDMGDKKHTHKIATLCQSINNGSSTLYRATERGFKVWKSPDPTKLENWIYDNRMYFFSVSK